MKILTAVVFAICLSAGAAQAKMMHKMAMAACGDGMAKATCMCKAAMGPGHAMCKKGMWCHTFTGTCSQ